MVMSDGAYCENGLDDLLNYEYELNGVVVHSGVAGGSHYYAFIKDREQACYHVASFCNLSPEKETEVQSGQCEKESRWTPISK